MCGHPSTWVTRSRSISSSVLPGLELSSKTNVAPACIAAMRVKLKPPTQKSGIGV